jgi:predicted SnoaL-like aldol condensation-catalyzing enzyme
MRVVVLVALAALLTGCASVDRPQAEASRMMISAAANKKVVVDFYRTVFIEKRVIEGFERFVAAGYIQHNPLLQSGREAAVKFLTSRSTRDSIADIKRVVAEGDLVVLHVRFTPAPGAPAYAIADIFRVQDCKIVEHWDAVEGPPKEQVNPKPRF